MKKMIFIVLLAAGCQRSSNQTWENIKTAGCYFSKSVGSVLGKKTGYESEEDVSKFSGPKEDYVPLNEGDVASLNSIQQSKLVPGKNNIPHLSKFQTPGNYASIFQTIHFDTDDHVIRNHNDLD